MNFDSRLFCENTSIDIHDQRFGDFAIIKLKTELSPSCVYVLVADDYSSMDCNGNTLDRVLAVAKNKNLLIVYTSCFGIDIDDSKPMQIDWRNTLSMHDMFWTMKAIDKICC